MTVTWPDLAAAQQPSWPSADALDAATAELRTYPPLVFAVIGERLYLFRDAARRDRFLAAPELVRQAEAAWPGLQDQLDMPPRDAPIKDAPR